MPSLAHGIFARVEAPFDRVIKAVEGSSFVNVYFEIFDTVPKMAIAVGQRFFFRAGNYLTATVVFVERGAETLLKIVTCGGKQDPLDFTDLGASRTYAEDLLKTICGSLQVKCDVIRHVNQMDISKSNLLR